MSKLKLGFNLNDGSYVNSAYQRLVATAADKYNATQLDTVAFEMYYTTWEVKMTKRCEV